ncbi:efflux RND transporter periplasmic adaptor subunit [Methylocapsa acidiphila]|uniref:efflux RND transporter periplasmic adaptor subunit n=1 Tax=Methylocapsa acidiphila TaxID=133552 RepID=UPI000404AFB5|nr:efflux RND transporter periplasmic adaptor subunit [Methylocapsa acidiphila]
MNKIAGTRLSPSWIASLKSRLILLCQSKLNALGIYPDAGKAAALCLAAVLAAGAGGYWAGHYGFGPPGASKSSENASAADSSKAAGNGERRIRFYRNPMGLPDTSTTPKKDSMGMDYIPVFDNEDDDGSIIKLSPGKLQRSGVRSEIVAKHVLSRPLRAPGSVQLDERRVSLVSTRSDSFIEQIENVTTGDRVRKGQALMRLHSPEILAASTQFISNIGSESARRRLENLNVPAEAISEMERLHKVAYSLSWIAPRDGIVLERKAVEGMKAAAGDALFRIADISTIWVIADVPEHELNLVRIGAAAQIRVRGLPDRAFGGRVGLIYPQVNSATRSARVRVEIANPDGLLLPDMYAEVEIATGRPVPVVAAPDSAVIDTGLRQIVILDKGEGRFEPREVKVGMRGAGLTEIREGLESGEKVVIAANFLIDAESNLKAALSGMRAADAAP